MITPCFYAHAAGAIIERRAPPPCCAIFAMAYAYAPVSCFYAIDDAYFIACLTLRAMMLSATIAELLLFIIFR